MVTDAYRHSCPIFGAFVLGQTDYYSPIPEALEPLPVTIKEEAAPEVVPDLPYLPMVRRMRQAGWGDLSNRWRDHLPAGTCLWHG